jgi:ligand-binding sensor domain-containing protein/signal transduction histidine kinase/DNA-binding response OmpR family regulator
MKRQFIFVIFFVVAIVFKANSQTGIFYSTDKDISNSLINGIYQDKRNYLWIATEDGLNKFDGIKFTVYKNEPNDTTSLKNNYVRCLFEDSKNRFWVGCINGLQQFDRKTNTFEKVELLSSANQRLYPHIMSIIEDNDGCIWISTSGEGILKISEKNDKTFQTVTAINSKLPTPYLTFIFQDSAEKFWIGTANYGLYLYDASSGQMHSFSVQNRKIGNNEISAIAEDKDKNIFIGTLSGGLYRFDRKNCTFIPIKDATGNASLPVKSLFFDRKQNMLLVGTDGQGLRKLNDKTWLLEKIELNSSPFDFSKTKVHSILRDNAGNLWFGLFQKGVFLVRNNPYQFNYIGHKSFSQNLIGSSCVSSIYKDKNNTLWVGTDNDGLYRLENNGVKTIHYPTSNRAGSVPATVSAIVELDKGEIWLGSFSQGLVFFDKHTGHCVYYQNIPPPIQSNNWSIKINCLIKDDNDNLWIGTHGGGLYVFDTASRTYIKHYGSNTISNEWVCSLFMDEDKRIWVGTYKGYSIIDTKNSRIQNNVASELSNAVIYTISCDKTGNMWIGTTEGLYVLDGKNGTLLGKYTTEDGLPSNVICGIVEDDQQNIWLSTHNGLSKYNTRENIFINYYNSDGLQGNEFSRGAFYKNSSDEIYFGGINGITFFNPSQIKEKREELQLFLIALNIGDKTVFCNNKNKKDKPQRFISDLDTLYLDYNDNIFNLEFSTFDYGIPEQISYRYQLEGFNNNEWIHTEPGVNKIHFTNVNYGKYRLKIMASVHDTYSPIKEIILIISPPWYLSRQAITAYILLFLLIIAGVVKYIYDRIKYRHELVRQQHIEEINEAKLQYFTNISHDIRTPMSLIISPLEKLMTSETDVQKKYIYQIMYRNANRILRLINQMMDIRKIEKGQMVIKFRETDIVGFIEDLMKTFEYTAQRRNIEFKFLHQETQLNAWIDIDNFDKVMMNVLSNAFKFTPDNGNVVVSLKSVHDSKKEEFHTKDYLEITISDSGLGIDENDTEKIFDRFYQSENNYTGKNAGTGIGLHLSRSIMGLLHGTITARNKKDEKGAEFIIRLPLGKEHLSSKEINTSSATKESVETIIEQPISLYEQPNPVPENKIKPKTKFQVLIVEDDDEIRNYLKNELSSYFKVEEATNGKEAWKMIHEKRPDLIISDIMMPEMDGIMLCKKIKSNVEVNHIPVILLTAKSTVSDKAEGLDVGADAYIVKPFNIDLLIKQSMNLIENRNRIEIKPLENKEIKDILTPTPLQSADQQLLEKVVKLINENISDPDLSVEFLAENIGISRVHLYRKLKELTNQSPSDFIKTIRIKQAAVQLANQKVQVSEVAYSVGFSNLSHFSNSFKEYYGISPTEYAEKYRDKSHPNI